MKKFVTILIILFIAHLVVRIYTYRFAYITPFDAGYWKQKYENSQWSTKKACENHDPHVNPYTCIWDDTWYAYNKNNAAADDLKENTIGDDGVYTYAGWEYINGHDPTTLNAEVPPFGKYLIGLSEVILKNQNIFALVTGIFALVGFYFVNIQILKNRMYAFIPVFFFSFEPLFYTQLRATYLDQLYFGLLCLIFYFLLTKKYSRSAMLLGCMAATKSAASTFPLVIGVTIFYLLITKQYGAIKKYCISLPLAGIVFLLTYIKYFFLGHSFIQFLGVQKWIINFYAIGAKGSLLAPWQILFTGKYGNWWGQQSIVTEWHVGWILLFIASLLTFFYMLKYVQKSSGILICIWIFSYLIFLSFVPVWSRYFLVILPFMYTLTIWLILHHYKKI